MNLGWALLQTKSLDSLKGLELEATMRSQLEAYMWHYSCALAALRCYVRLKLDNETKSVISSFHQDKYGGQYEDGRPTDSGRGLVISLSVILDD